MMIADPLVVGEEVVAVWRRLPREDAIVDPEQADDSMRH
jgi:hypothetical protein